MVDPLKLFFSGTSGPISMYVLLGPGISLFFSNDDHGLTFDLLYDNVTFCKLIFYIGKCDNDGFLGNYCSL